MLSSIARWRFRQLRISSSECCTGGRIDVQRVEERRDCPASIDTPARVGGTVAYPGHDTVGSEAASGG